MCVCGVQVEQAAAEVLECSEAWRKAGATAKPAGSILRLLAALDDLPAAAMLNAAYAMDGEFSFLFGSIWGLYMRVTVLHSATH